VFFGGNEVERLHTNANGFFGNEEHNQEKLGGSVSTPNTTGHFR
jgi:hypothetical protein